MKEKNELIGFWSTRVFPTTDLTRDTQLYLEPDGTGSLINMSLKRMDVHTITWRIVEVGRLELIGQARLLRKFSTTGNSYRDTKLFSTLSVCTAYSVQVEVTPALREILVLYLQEPLGDIATRFGKIGEDFLPSVERLKTLLAGEGMTQ
jgi:hypothetical protein